MNGANTYATFKKLMEDSGKTVYQVAKDTGIPPTTLYEWGYGRSTPKVDKLLILANYFNVPLDQFVKLD